MLNLEILDKLEPIAPHWTKHLKETGLRFPQFTDTAYNDSPIWTYRMSNFARCIVGEAYKQDSSYISTCDVCEQLAECLCGYYAPEYAYEFGNQLLLFIGHWNQVHLDGQKQR